MNKKLLLGCLLTSYVTFSQVESNGSPPANNTNSRAQAAWYRGGNVPDVNNNIFGTLWNSPIYTVTNGVNRMKLNGDWNYPINGVTPPAALGRNGFLLLGVIPPVPAEKRTDFSS